MYLGKEAKSHSQLFGQSNFVHFRLFRPFSSDLRPISSFSSMDEVFCPKSSKLKEQLISINISREKERGGSNFLRPFSSMNETSAAGKACPIRVLCQGIEKEPIRFLIRVLFYQTGCPIVVPKAGLEPARPKPGDFKSPASAIPPLRHAAPRRKSIIRHERRISCLRIQRGKKTR